MNLLTDPWIPVRNGARFEQISYKTLLCTEQPELQVALPRDDLELACIQMLAAMTQVIFMPADKRELRERIETPLSEREYDSGVKKYKDWFDLDHPKWPFMQMLEPETDESTPIQKLFPGLPAGNNHSFFNEKDEFEKICPSCAALSLFNLCTHAPNLSGKHKGGLRGNAPVSTIVYDSVLRKMAWMNVLAKDRAVQIFPAGSELDYPAWVKAIERGKQIPAAVIGIARGLFWTPLLVRLRQQEEVINCDCCGTGSKVGIRDFLLGSNFKFDVKGLWRHPFSPRQLNVQKEDKKGYKPAESIVSFRTTEPAWTQFTELLFQSATTDKKEGYIPAAVVSQYSDAFSDKPIHLLIGGYRNKQAAVLQRRHELYTFPAGWNDNSRSSITEVVEIGLEAEKMLTDKVLYPVVKGDSKKGEKGVGVAINTKASVLYFHLTESLIHRMLCDASLREFVQAKNRFLEDLTRICFDIFERVTRPYVHKPELTGTVALARVKLKGLLNKLKKDHTVAGGTA